MQWQIRNRTLGQSRLPHLMAIINVTPDSFSDGGRFADPFSPTFRVDCSAAVDEALAAERSGASILDLGGQSTRPGSLAVEPEEELRRVLPVLRELIGRTSIPISIDTTSALVADECARAGASIVNDISGGTFEPDLVDVVKKYELGFCVCHIQGRPETMQNNPRYNEVVSDVMNWLAERRRFLIEFGLDPKSICLDPGFGFGKNFEQNRALVKNIDRFHELEAPLLVGYSRKKMLSEFLLRRHDWPNNENNEKTAELDRLTAQLAVYFALRRVQFIRVHNVSVVRSALERHFRSENL